MGIFNESLKDEGFNSREIAYVYGGAIIGALAPIVAGRYLIFGFDVKPIKQELMVWGLSLGANLITMIPKPHIPAPVYGLIVGAVTGTLASTHSREKRYKQGELERLTHEKETKPEGLIQ